MNGLGQSGFKVARLFNTFGAQLPRATQQRARTAADVMYTEKGKNSTKEEPFLSLENLRPHLKPMVEESRLSQGMLTAAQVLLDNIDTIEEPPCPQDAAASEE